MYTRKKKLFFTLPLILIFLGCVHFIGAEKNPVRGLANQSERAVSKGLAEDSDSLQPINLKLRTADWFDSLHHNEPNLQNLIGIYSNAESAPIINFIHLAKKSIDIEIYQMTDKEVRKALREAISKPKPILVRVVQEPSPVGDSCSVFGKPPKKGRTVSDDCLDLQSLTQEIQQSGGSFVPFVKDELCGQSEDTRSGSCVQHGKVIVVDGKFALISTGNFNQTNLCDLTYSPPPKACNRDFTYITRDPEVVKAIQDIFNLDLIGKRYDLKEILNRGNLADKLTVSPFSYEPLVALINSAKKSIQIENQYIRPNSGLAEVLIAKAKQSPHIQIEVQLSDECGFGTISAKRAADDGLMFSEMENAGIKIRMFPAKHQLQGRPGYLHAKAIVVDGEDPHTARAWVGSVNGSDASLNQNREYGIFFTQFDRVNSLSKMLKEDMEDPNNKTYQESLSCPIKSSKKKSTDTSESD